MVNSSSSTFAVIDIRGQHVVVDNSVQTENYIHCSLFLFFDPNTNTAFLKLRLSITPGENALWLYIYPEHITNLVFDPSNLHVPELAVLCGSTARGSVALRLTLRKPGDIVVPPDWSPHDGSVTQETLDNVRFFAGQTDLVLHLPHGVVATPQLRSLCRAASSDGLLSVSHPHARLTGLYQGRVGKVFQESLEATAFDTTPHDVASHETEELPAVPPPAYDNPPGPPRPPQSSFDQAGSSRKRRRANSEATTASPTPEVEVDTGAKAHVPVADGILGLHDQMRTYFQEVCKEMLDKRIADLRREYLAELDKIRREIFAELHTMKARCNARVDEQINSLRNDVYEDVLDKIHHDVSDYVGRDELDMVIDDKVTGIKIECEDWVKDEMVVAQEKIIEHFENGYFVSRFRPGDVDE